MRPIVSEPGRHGPRVRSTSTRAIAILLSCTALTAACADDEGEELTVFAAASLADVVDRLGDRFEELTDVDVRVSTAGSSTLRLQLDEGADADVFLPADLDQFELLDVELDAAPVVWAGNELVVANRADGPVVTVGDFERDSLLLGACAPQVPCGTYAAQAFDAAGVTPALDTEEPDVRAVAAKVAEGELDAGVVYRTDVLADGRLVAVEWPREVADSLDISYAAGVLADSAHRDTAVRFVEFLRSDDAATILDDAGFTVP